MRLNITLYLNLDMLQDLNLCVFYTILKIMLLLGTKFITMLKPLKSELLVTMHNFVHSEKDKLFTDLLELCWISLMAS